MRRLERQLLVQAPVPRWADALRRQLGVQWRRQAELRPGLLFGAYEQLRALLSLMRLRQALMILAHSSLPRIAPQRATTERTTTKHTTPTDLSYLFGKLTWVAVQLY
jgi:hypothetical protein